MKKLVLSLLTVFFCLGAVAQSAEAYNAGNEAYKAKNYKEAIENYEKYAMMEEMSAPLAKTIATCHYKLKDFNNAIKFFNKALDLKYNKPIKLHLSIIACYAKLKDAEGKLTATLKANKAFPKYKKFSMMLTNHYYKAAAVEYQKGGKMVSDAYDKYGVKNKKKEYANELKKADKFFEKAKEDLETALSFTPNDPKSLNMKKDIESKLNKK